MRQVSVVVVMVGVLSLLGAACSGHDPPIDDEAVDCTVETRDDNIVSGLEKVGDRGQVTFRLMATSPAPPARLDNTWTLQLEGAGAPLDGAAVGAKPFMPDHRHGTAVKPIISATGTPGEYKFDQLNLWMPGLWDITFEATPLGGSKDVTVFRVCIPG
jgi:YtkA-like